MRPIQCARNEGVASLYRKTGDYINKEQHMPYDFSDVTVKEYEAAVNARLRQQALIASARAHRAVQKGRTPARTLWTTARDWGNAVRAYWVRQAHAMEEESRTV